MPAHRLVLHEHPFASYCQKPLIALHELGMAFETTIVGGEEDRRALARLWPMASIPVLRDETADRTIAESTTVIEYLDALAPGGPRLVPADPEAALQARFWDRFHDGYVATPMQKIVGDALRPEGREDPEGVAQARSTLDTAYAYLDAELADRAWTAGAEFSLADCAAAPALFYARVVHPWDESALTQLTRCYRDLMHRPSVARVIDDALPHRELFPLPWPAGTDEHRPAASG